MNIMYRYTWRILKKHKTRTFVTILGVILAVAFLTVISLSIKSIERYYLQDMNPFIGDWDVEFFQISPQIVGEIKQDPNIEEYTQFNHYGYSSSLAATGLIRTSPLKDLWEIQQLSYPEIDPLPNPEAAVTPRTTFRDVTFFLSLSGMEKKAFPQNVSLESGRFPESNQEIILPKLELWIQAESLFYGAEIGDEIEIEMGTDFVWQMGEEENEVEDDTIVGLQSAEQKRFTVVGFYEGGSILEQGSFFYFQNPITRYKNDWQRIEALTVIEEGEDPSVALQSNLILKISPSVSLLPWMEQQIKQYDLVSPPLVPYPSGYSSGNESQIQQAMAIRAEVEKQPMGYLKAVKAYNFNFNYEKLVRQGIFTIHTINLPEEALGILAEQSSGRLFFQLIYIIVATVAILGSVALIFNAFSISIVQRSRELGLLASIGASRFQIFKSLLFEAGVVSVVALPIGIGGGMIITQGFFMMINLLIVEIIMQTSNISIDLLTVYFSGKTILWSLGLGIVTILLSVFSPTLAMMRLSVIESLKQNAFKHQIFKRKFKQNDLLMGRNNFNLKLAWKNYTRNRRQYKATVLSLTICVVVFMTVQSFLGYAFASGNINAYDSKYDFMSSYYANYNGAGKRLDYKKWRSFLLQQEGVENIDLVLKNGSTLCFPVEQVSLELQSRLTSLKEEGDLSLDSRLRAQGERFFVETTFIFVEDEKYKSIVKLTGNKEMKLILDERNGGLKVRQISGLMDDRIVFSAGYSGKTYMYHLFTKQKTGMTVGFSEVEMPGTMKAEFENLPEITLEGSLDMPDRSRRSQWGFFNWAEEVEGIQMLFPFSAFPLLYNQEIEDAWKRNEVEMEFYFKTSKEKQVEDKIMEIHHSLQLMFGFVNIGDEQVASASLEKMINVLAYVFLVLISLIAGANVFNTVSTNMYLRRREFAVYKSIGLDDRTLRKVNYYECFIFGFKALLYGFAISLGVNLLIQKIFSFTYGNIKLVIPWLGMMIATGSIMVVVLAAMIYSNRKLAGENVIDILKQENC